MSIKEKLKKIDFLRGIVKKIKIYREYLFDAKDFSRYYLEKAEKNGNYRYRLMLIIHNIEKGMSRSNPRPFGKEKVALMVKILKKYPEKDKNQFEYKLACATLKNWKDFYIEREWNFDEISPEVRSFIIENEGKYNEAGIIVFNNPRNIIQNQKFEEVIFSRRSVRDFEERELIQEDVDFALKCFLETPTACNRQMCRVYQIKSNKAKELLANTILGIGGFNIDTVTLFLFTYDLAAFEFYGERNQGYVNVGLTAMNFANGLHSRGIGSCFMQWSNKRSDDIKIRRELGLEKSERIGLILGAGYYKDETIIPYSKRKPIKDIYEII